MAKEYYKKVSKTDEYIDLVAKAYQLIVKAKPELRKDKKFRNMWGKLLDWATDLDR